MAQFVYYNFNYLIIHFENDHSFRVFYGILLGFSPVVESSRMGWSQKALEGLWAALARSVVRSGRILLHWVAAFAG
jgi:hypothetical protein